MTGVMSNILRGGSMNNSLLLSQRESPPPSHARLKVSFSFYHTANDIIIAGNSENQGSQ